MTAANCVCPKVYGKLLAQVLACGSYFATLPSPAVMEQGLLQTAVRVKCQMVVSPRSQNKRPEAFEVSLWLALS